jgi:hypothetical protein
MSEPIIGGQKVNVNDPTKDIRFIAACERQRSYWSEKLPNFTDTQIAILMDTLVNAINLVTYLDAADSARVGQNYQSKLGNNLRMIFELIQAPPEVDNDNVAVKEETERLDV